MAELQDTGVVVRPRNIFRKQEPLNPLAVGTAQDRVDAAGVAPKGAVGQDDPTRAQAQRMAQQYSPMLMGGQPQTNEQVVNTRNTVQTQNFAAPYTGGADNAQGVLDYLASQVTTPEQEEKMRKSSLANQRIMAVADALRHIGNIYNTVNYAPAQKFNSPVLEEQQRYERGKALRDKANLTYLTYQQAKEIQDAKQRRWEAEQKAKADQWNATFRFNAEKAAADRAERQRQFDTTFGFNKEKQKATEERWKRQDANTVRHQKAMEGIASRNASANERRTTAYVNKINSGGSSGVPPLDTPKGQIVPNGKNYSNQIEQIWSFAKEKGLVKESDVEKQLRTLGLGKDKSADVRHQMVLDLLRTNQSIGDYASDRLGWKYGGGTNMDLGLEDEEDEMDLGLE